ncbi:MAG: MFS transporter [Methanomassiliicoccales archaeon]|nr:MFS transporter [Methanomassiliicoccales archaeon]
MALTYFLVYFHRVSPAVLATDMQESFGVGLTSIALLSSVYFYAYTVMQLPCGILTDRWGPRRTVCAFTALAALGAFVTALASSFGIVVMGRAMIGLGVAMVYVPTLKVLSAWFRHDQFGSLTGLLLTVGNIGGLAAAGPLAYMSEAVGWRQVFLVLGVLTATLTWLMWALVRDRPQDVPVSDHERPVDLASGRGMRDGTNGRIPVGRSLRLIFGSGRRFWPLAVCFFFVYGGIMVYQGLWGGPFFRDVLGWDKGTYGTSLTFIAIGMIVGCPLSGLLSDRVLRSRRKVLVIGMVIFTSIWALMWLMAGRVEGQVPYIIVHLLFGFFGGWYVPIYGQLKDLFPSSMDGTAIAALNIFPFLGGAVLQQLTGYMVVEGSLSEYRSVWLLMLVGMVIACACALLSKEGSQEDA